MSLQGPLSRVKDLADALTKSIATDTVTDDRASHALHHQNTTAFKYQFHIPRESAREIVHSCTHCPTFLPTLAFRVNSPGLLPNMLWHVDVTHVPGFGHLCRRSFVHVTTDTFSHVIITTARTAEVFQDITIHVEFPSPGVRACRLCTT